MKRNFVNLVIALPLIILVGIGCSNFDISTNSNQNSSGANKTEDSKKTVAASAPAKLDSYSIKGIKFAYYKIPSGLKKEDLVAMAQKIHDQEDDTQLIFVDDDSKVAEYIKYAKAISGIGELEDPMPMEWADAHIVANVQKYMNGKFVLCEGYGSKEIAELK